MIWPRVGRSSPRTSRPIKEDGHTIMVHGLDPTLERLVFTRG